MSRIKAVIGLGFGDEGKGITTDYLCSRTKSPLVIRYSGGQQAGHTVVFDGIRHVFSNFGAGSLRGATTYWSKHCTVDPVGLINELKILKSNGIDPYVIIDERCPVTTPFDKYRNITNEDNCLHGTCGVGVGETFKREENFYSLTFSDLFNPFVFQSKLYAIKDYYSSIFDTDTAIAPEDFQYFLDCCSTIIESDDNICSTINVPEIDEVTDHIFEGSQGLLLDQHIGFFPHVTRSNTGSKNILEMIGEYEDELELYLVTRAYQTRHGNGPMSNLHLSHNIKSDENETNVLNQHQGEFKRTLLDVSLLEYAINKDEFIRNSASRTLVITCLDHIVNEYRFTYDGKIVFCDNEEQFALKVASLLNISKIIISSSPESKNMITLKPKVNLIKTF
jgi:adenylosuccinate synthase